MFAVLAVLRVLVLLNAVALDLYRVHEFAHPRADTADIQSTLTARELDVLELVTEGLRNKEIAGRLGISENTAKFHLRNILEKLHADSRTELATRALREGFARDD